ncbi:FHA domain-containing protein FhaB/FipA [Thermomonospora umbrina]|uniref:FHA domain-containing protein n=1 Tax=Thermomonospora umbrina TaxID=111806 RepID=A0A3D9SN61_9ACTN|nr:FHA domain-containing protein [Thermomonospora umbrina]REE97359.1 FHA domain-containing protein [Thermomonospora umbrina]
MSEFTLTLIKLAFLAVLWLFVIAAVGVIRADLFGSKAAARAAARARAPRPARRPRPQGSPQQPAQPQRPPQPQGPRQLVVTQGDRAGMTLDLSAGAPILIGRANDATIVVTDDYASSRHARLFAQDGQWIVEDLGSTNGTYLGRNKVNQPTPIPPGVPIRIGKTVIELRP